MPQPAAATATGALPFAGDGSAQTIASAPTPQAAAIAADPGGASDSQNLFLLFTVVLLAVPMLVTMTLLATVLTRR